MEKIHVFRLVKVYGDGLIFTIYKDSYENDEDYEYLGTLEEFVEMIKKEIKRYGTMNFCWEG